MAYSITLHKRSYSFADLKTLMAKASPFRTGDALAGIAAGSNEERVAAQYLLAELPLQVFLEQLLIPYESDEISRLIIDSHDVESFAPIAGLSVAELRHWLLNPEVDALMLRQVAKGLSPEMLAAVSKIMRNQDLIAVAQKCEVQSKFRTTVGQKNRLSVRLQPNHPTDNNQAILASILDGLLYGCGDALIGINPATDSPEMLSSLLIMLDELRQKFEIPTQSCVLSHVSTIMQVIHKAPVDLVFQSIGGTEKTNSSFGINLAMLAEAQQAALELGRGQGQVMYFETGQGSSLSANAHHGIDQQTCEARAYAVARNFNPFLVNSVVGFIGPEYLFDGKQILRAALEDHFCAKLLCQAYGPAYGYGCVLYQPCRCRPRRCG